MKMKIKHFCIYHLPFMIMILVLGFIGCNTEPSVPVIMKFEVGEVVQFKLDGKPVYIIKRTGYDMEYKVRFGENYSSTWVGETELEPLSSKTEKDSIISELTNKLVEADEFKAHLKILIAEVEKE